MVDGSQSLSGRKIDLGVLALVRTQFSSSSLPQLLFISENDNGFWYIYIKADGHGTIWTTLLLICLDCSGQSARRWLYCFQAWLHRKVWGPKTWLVISSPVFCTHISWKFEAAVGTFKFLESQTFPYFFPFNTSFPNLSVPVEGIGFQLWELTPGRNCLNCKCKRRICRWEVSELKDLDSFAKPRAAQNEGFVLVVSGLYSRFSSFYLAGVQLKFLELWKNKFPLF